MSFCVMRLQVLPKKVSDMDYRQGEKQLFSQQTAYTSLVKQETKPHLIFLSMRVNYVLLDCIISHFSHYKNTKFELLSLTLPTLPITLT